MKTFSLPRDVVEKWLEDLESGRFQQVKGYLYKEYGDPNEDIKNKCGYCCLGVLLKGLGATKNLLDGVSEPCDIVDEYHPNPDAVDILKKYPLDIDDTTFHLQNILMVLNDGGDVPHLKKYPNLIWSIEIDIDLVESVCFLEEPFTFEQIAQFIRDNVELI